MKVMIYSNEHSLWWKPNYCGYTDNQDKAGIFDYDEAVKKYPNIGFSTYHAEDFFVKVDNKKDDPLVNIMVNPTEPKLPRPDEGVKVDE